MTIRPESSWSHAPYRPPFFDVGEPCICRLAPGADSVRVEWLASSPGPYRVYLRPRGGGDFALAGETVGSGLDVAGLAPGADYELYVASTSGRSRVRLVRTGAVFGTVVNYLHPDDDAYAFSGHYLCSPSLLRLPDNGLLASMDLYAGGAPQNLTLVFRSDDDGRTWHHCSELLPAFWTKLFLHRGAVYALACSTEYGDLLIGRSDDGGRTFGVPTVLLRGGGGKAGWAGVHKNPQPVVPFAGRLWGSLEWGSWAQGYHAAMVMSAPEDADLLDAASWRFSEPVPYDPAAWGLPLGPSIGCLEGCLVEREGVLYNVMRYQMEGLTPNYGLAPAFRVDADNPEAPIRFERAIPFPANHSKFEIRRHPGSGRYYSLATRIVDTRHPGARNLLSLMASDDLWHWEVVADVQNRLSDDPAKVGLQYVDFLIEGDRILFLTRLADNGAHSYHDANYSVFDTLDLKMCKRGNVANGSCRQ